MMRALAWSVIWILGGAVVAGALYWAFLNTPESTIFTLGLSLLLVVAIYVVLAVTTCGAVAGWRSGWRQPFIGRALSAVPGFILPVLFVLAVWWIVGRWLDWIDMHGGEIGAWFIATFDWSDVRPVLNGVRLAGEWLRTVAAPFAALVWLGHALAGGWRPVAPYTCLAHVGSPSRLALVTAIAAVALWAPITYGLYWVPRGLPPTWVEPAVAAVKLGVMAVAGATGLSLIIRLSVAR